MKPCGRAMMYRKGWGGEASTADSARHTMFARTQSEPDSARHALAHRGILMFSLYGKHYRMFYAFLLHVSLHSSSKRRWHGICLCRAALFRPIVDNTTKKPITHQTVTTNQTKGDPPK